MNSKLILVDAREEKGVKKGLKCVFKKDSLARGFLRTILSLHSKVSIANFGS